MIQKKLPKSIRKYIRQEKTRIRREVLNIKDQKKHIDSLYQKFLKKNENTGNLQPSHK